MNNEWENLEREDLKAIPKLRKKGWKVRFSLLDNSQGRTTPDKPPQDPVEFEKDRCQVVNQLTPNGLCWTYVTAGRECREYDTLEELIETHL